MIVILKIDLSVSFLPLQFKRRNKDSSFSKLKRGGEKNMCDYTVPNICVIILCFGWYLLGIKIGKDIKEKENGNNN